jgi:LCP family protein required for cell wall assembly
MLIVGGLSAMSLFAVKVDQAVNVNVQRTEELPAETPTEKGAAPRPQRQATSNAVNYLLLGADDPVGSASGSRRSDVMMLLHLDGNRRSASLISFPRDLYVSIPGHGKNKINAAYAFGGTQLAVRTVEGLLDVRIDHVAVIDFAGFIALTESIGGVTVYNEHPSVSQGWTFPRGKITISGEEALAYVRERKQLPNGDLDRAQRQRVVLQAILAKGLSKEMLTDPDRFVRFAGDLARHVRIDKSLTESELRSTVLSLRMTPDDLQQLQAPISGFGTSPTKQSIDLVDTVKMAKLGAALRADKLAEYRAKYANG